MLLAILTLVPTFLRDSTPASWPTKKIKLGLDLKGGVYLVLGVQTGEAVKSQLATMAGSIKSDKELRKLGVSIVKAKQVGERDVEFTLLGERGVEPLDNFIRKEYPQLAKGESHTEGERYQVRYTVNELRANEIKKSSVDQAIETIRNRVDQFGVSEPTIQRSGEDRVIVQLPDIFDIENVKKTIGSVAKLEFRLVSDGATRGSVDTITRRSREGGDLKLEDEIQMTGDSIETAQVHISPQNNEVEVALRLNNIGAKTFDRVTGDNVNRRLAIVLDDVVQSAPVIRDRISGGNAQITGGFTPEEAHRLAIVLRSGALPAPLTFMEQRVVGASLGSDSIKMGLYASAVGCALVVLFMVLYYGKSGALAVLCLAVNIVILLAMLALFGATLTLPGIAGLALTAGMAVDSNIIVFERIREELRLGSTPKAAVEAGFDRAHWTILDANITTLLAGVILYAFASGPIKGFAVTLSLGILTTVFTALVVSHLGFQIFNMRRKNGTLSI